MGIKHTTHDRVKGDAITSALWNAEHEAILVADIDSNEFNAANKLVKLDADAVVPLVQICDTLTGKDADTVDGIEGAEIIRAHNLKWDSFVVFDFSSWDAATANYGEVTQKSHQLRLYTAGVADGKASAWSNLKNYIVSSLHLPFAVQDFDVNTKIGWVVGLEDSLPTGKAYLLYGGGVTVINPEVESFGFRIDNTAVKGIVHDGTSLHVIDLNTTLSIDLIYRLSLVFEAGNKIEWFINDVSKGSTTQIPSGNTKSIAVDRGNLSAQVTNGGTGSSYVLNCFKVSFEQEIW